MKNGKPDSLADILKQLARHIKSARKAQKGCALAQKILRQTLGDRHLNAAVVSLKVGVAVIETDETASFQELEGFERQKLLSAFREGGLKVAEVRVRLRTGVKKTLE